MSRTANRHSAKPVLEQLEERAQPSILLFGNTVQSMAQPLNNMVKDMQAAQADLKTQFGNLQTNTLPPPGSFNGAEQVLVKMVGDWQRILNDSAAVKAISSVDLNVINNIAFSEFASGDTTDLFILAFGPLFGFTPTKAISDTVTEANGILNDPTLNNIVNTNLHTVNADVDTTVPISQLVIAPTF